jgi:hypothetical protein
VILAWVRESIDEPVADIMFRATWQGVDPDELSLETFWSMVESLPAAIRRRWGYRVHTRGRLEFEQSECDRLAAYTVFKRSERRT